MSAHSILIDVLMHKTPLWSVIETKNLNQINRKHMEIINANKFYSKQIYIKSDLFNFTQDTMKTTILCLLFVKIHFLFQ